MNKSAYPVAMFRDSLELVYAIADLVRHEHPALPGPITRTFVADADQAHRLCLDGPGDVVVMSLDDVISCATGRHPNAAKVVCYAPVHAGFLRLIARPGITSISDLAGKKVAVDTDTGYASALYEMLAMHGLDHKRDVTVVYAGATDLRYEKLTRGGFDATLLGAPFSTLALAKGYRDLGRPRAALAGYQGTVFAARRDWLEANHVSAMAPVDCFRKTVEWASHPGNRAAAVKLIEGLLVPLAASGQASAVYEELFGPASEFTTGEQVRPGDAAVVVRLFEKARSTKLSSDILKRISYP